MLTREKCDADLMLAMQHHRAGRLDEAEVIYQRLHLADRGDTQVIYQMGILCCDLGLYEAACRFFEDALARSPAFSEARGQLAVARECWADLQRGTDANTLSARGLAELEQENYAAAEDFLRQALLLRPTLNPARNNLGLALGGQGHLSAARKCFEAALLQDASYTSARINLANTLRILGEPESARRELEIVLAAQPDATDALNNLGAVLQDLGLGETALACLTRAAALSPQTPQIRWNLALSQLQLGDFPNGWSNFETRWEGCAHLRGGYDLPRARAWRGESLAGKRLLLWAEQGFGDTLQFIRFAADAAELGARVTARVQPELASLVRCVPGISDVTSTAEPTPAYDLHCPLMSLPHWLGLSPNAAALRGDAPYLRAPANKLDHWRQRLDGYAGLKVGLVWAGSSRLQRADLAAIDARRSIEFQELTPLLAVSGCSFFSLQKGNPDCPQAAKPKGIPTAYPGENPQERSSEPAPPRRESPEHQSADSSFHDFSSEWTDFSDTAAFLANLDLIISVDTAVAHLAGGLGKPVWLLNRYDSCWRWLLARTDSPWYRTLRQFRQSVRGDWRPVVEAVAGALAVAAATTTATAITTATTTTTATAAAAAAQNHAQR